MAIIKIGLQNYLFRTDFHKIVCSSFCSPYIHVPKAYYTTKCLLHCSHLDMTRLSAKICFFFVDVIVSIVTLILALYVLWIALAYSGYRTL
jgi:hypothetical protein